MLRMPFRSTSSNQEKVTTGRSTANAGPAWMKARSICCTARVGSRGQTPQLNLPNDVPCSEDLNTVVEGRTLPKPELTPHSSWRQCSTNELCVSVCVFECVNKQFPPILPQPCTPGHDGFRRHRMWFPSMHLFAVENFRKTKRLLPPGTYSLSFRGETAFHGPSAPFCLHSPQEISHVKLKVLCTALSFPCVDGIEICSKVAMLLVATTGASHISTVQPCHTKSSRAQASWAPGGRWGPGSRFGEEVKLSGYLDALT